MTARELSREFRHDLGAVVVRVQADGAPVEVHTIYVTAPGGCPACGRPANGAPAVDIEWEIQARIREAGDRRERVLAAFRMAGMQE